MKVHPRVGTRVPVYGNWPLTFPLWFPTALAATLAAGPWIPVSCRFSLRTLLIATTLVAVVLGLIVWLNHH
jgi:hypothetical protein